MTGTARESGAGFAHARQIADAVLFEGYVLYPYRASAAKNRLRWQFGVLAPPRYGADSGEHSHQRTECVMEPRPGDRLAVELRFLRLQRRTVQQACGNGAFRTVEELELADRVLVPWDEGIEERIELSIPTEELTEREVVREFDLAAGEEMELLTRDGAVAGRLLRRREQARGRLRITVRDVPGPYRAQRLTVLVENTSPWAPPPGTRREAALARALVSAHLLLGLERGSFLSPTDPPQWAAQEVRACRNEHTWPVLAGPPGSAGVLLSSPIILEDHPHIAPESPGALYDATEIDEILALRTAALTEREKREARGTDERAGAVIDLADSMPPEILERLHGAVRGLRELTDPAPRAEHPWWDPGNDPQVDPARDRVMIDGRPVGAGSRVRLRPGRRRTDAQDLFLHGRTALVEAVLQDVDGSVHLAVTVDDDPGADLWRAQGRYRYFQPDEVTVLEGA
ncbi:hypothetical protein [Streptomyces rubellomurinus]|uniref:Uncharacterized protein n=1 Tax=Streptomyces rubellomurinus (strain ATCC 31215) TaxID=359131 RepID=A0A0F2TFW2_STRR3|nr:hypothetical protein [Streptomyces rubellomurinus]KJS61436.1 hypothetical protein VM95_14830 [Streptomyces rubellomurinus]